MKILYCLLLAVMLLLGLLQHFDLTNAGSLASLSYDRLALFNHEYWRLLTAHLSHLNFAHAAMNTAALALLIVAFWGDIGGKFDASNIILCILFVDIGLLFLHPELMGYVGFSGVLHGLIAYYLVKTIGYNKFISWTGIAVVALKIVWEQSPWADTSQVASIIGGEVITAAHLYGGVCGLAVGALYQGVQHRNPQP